MPADLPKDVSLCLFRITQEALQNAVKHSGVDQFTVELSSTEHLIQLVVCDAGAGFNVEEAKKGKGLGLLSMQERIHQVNGNLFVESKPWQGTKVIVSVPVLAESPGTTADAVASITEPS